MTLSAEEFMTIFPRIGADVQLEIKKIDTAPVSKEPRAPRQSSTGKLSVNEAILQTLSDGPASVGALKEALLSAGKSAASLSTGIAALTKSGKIERTGDGEYSKAA
jgi:hypothetical protein